MQFTIWILIKCHSTQFPRNQYFECKYFWLSFCLQERNGMGNVKAKHSRTRMRRAETRSDDANLLNTKDMGMDMDACEGRCLLNKWN